MQVFPLRTVEGLALSLAKPYKNKERNTCGGIPPHYLLIAQKMGANYLGIGKASLRLLFAGGIGDYE